MPQPVVVAIDHPSSVGAARREASRLAALLGFDVTVAGQLAIAVTEVASNIGKHAGRGMLALRRVERQDGAGQPVTAGLEVLAIDRGPGIANIGRSLNDGYSTAGTQGTGLGAIRRLTENFEIYSQPGKGTVVRFESWQRTQGTFVEHPPTAMPHGGISTTMPGETECGDDWLIASSSNRHVLFVVDGLGHGPEAAIAARVAVAAAMQAAHLGAEELLAEVHAALRPTRGAAAAVAILWHDKASCTYCGIGNISASIRRAGASRSMMSHNGILGHQVRTMKSFSYPFPHGALCIAHTDGLAARWDMDAYPGLEARHPALIAAVLLRDHGRSRDDTTVVAARGPGSPSACAS